MNEEALVACAGLGGADHIGDVPAGSGDPAAGYFFDLVFFVMLTSVLPQETSLSMVVRWLGIDAKLCSRGETLLGTLVTGGYRAGSCRDEVPVSSLAPGKRLVDVSCPDGILVTLMRPGGR